MIKFSTPKPWTLALAASFVLTYGSFTAIAASFQHAAHDAACVVQLPPVTVVGKRAAVADEFADQSVQAAPQADTEPNKLIKL
jgi:hypothetical protein